MTKLGGELEDIVLNPHTPNKTTQVGSDLSGEFKDRLRDFLVKNRDVFSWTHKDMLGIDPRVAVHKLNVDPASRPIKQKKRNFTLKHNQLVAKQVKKLLAGSRFHKKSLLSRLVSQCGDGVEAERKMVNVCRLHRLK